MKLHHFRSILKQGVIIAATLFLLACTRSHSDLREFSSLKAFTSCKEIENFLSDNRKLTRFESTSTERLDQSLLSSSVMKPAARQPNLVAQHGEISIFLSPSKRMLYFSKSSLSEELNLVEIRDLQENFWDPLEIFVLGDHLMLISERRFKMLELSFDSISKDGDEANLSRYPIRIEAFDLKGGSFEKRAEQMLSGHFVNAGPSRSGAALKVIVSDRLWADDSGPLSEIRLARTGRWSLTKKAFEEGSPINCEKTYFVPAAQMVSTWSTNHIFDIQLIDDEIQLVHHFSLATPQPAVIMTTLDGFEIMISLEGAAQHTDLHAKNTLNGISQNLTVRLEENDSGLSIKAQGFLPEAEALASNRAADEVIVRALSIGQMEDFIRD